MASMLPSIRSSSTVIHVASRAAYKRASEATRKSSGAISKQRAFTSVSSRHYAKEVEQFKHQTYAGPPPPRPSSSTSSSNNTDAQAQPRSRREGQAGRQVDNKKDAGGSSETSASAPSSQASTSGSGSSARTASDSPSSSSSRIESTDNTSRPSAPEGFTRRPLDGKLYAPDLPVSFGINQHAAGVSLFQADDAELQKDLEAIVADFRAPIRYAFAYGSGVFRQKGYSSNDKPMLDFVFAVSHPDHWHSINVNQNKDHYSFIARIFGSNVISVMQEKVGAQVWFNVECLVRGRIIKYGVISVDSLVKDLMDWETLYLAGRMHKPINVLRDEPRIKLANQVNLSSAVRASLLLLPETFSEEDLYSEITSLSYKGDFRMQVGENPHKVKNIVASQGEFFQKLYQPILRSFHKHVSFMGPEGSGSIRQDNNPRARAYHAKRLPLRLREMLTGHLERQDNIIRAMGKSSTTSEEAKKPSVSEESALWLKLVSQGDFKQNLDKSIQIIVARPAFSQSMKGALSVGPIRGVRYVWPKFKKRWLPGS